MEPIKILLVLTRTLGDVMLIHNLVDGCIKKFINCHITVVVESSYVNVLEGNNKINKIIPGKNWHLHWNDIIGMVVSKQYDEIMIPQQIHMEDNVWHQLEEYRHQHLVDFYLKRCRLPERTKEETLKIYPNEGDRILVEEFILSLPNNTDMVVLHTKSLVDGKDWDKFNELATEIDKRNLLIMQVGSQTDKIIESSRVIDCREKLSFRQIAALCKKAKCFVGLDSGLSYIAAASGCKSIIIQGSTIPMTSGPWGKNVINVVSKTRPECEKIRCHGNCQYKDKCINNVSVEEVLKHIC